MASKLDVINLGLSRLGANTIASITDGTAEQKLAVVTYDISRRAVLREHAWNFATLDIELSQVSGYESFEFQYAYQLPSDNVRLLQVYGNPTYKVQGRQILTDQATCKIKYVYDVTDTEQWDPAFTDVVAQRLAADMAYALTKTQTTSDSMYGIYQQKLKTAKHIDANEDVQDPIGGYDSIYIGVRF